MSPRFNDSLSAALPSDVWAQVAKHLPIADKTQLAQVNCSAAEGVRQSWSAADYFAAAQKPDKPERLRVAHGPAAPGDARAWLSLTQQMHFSMSAGGERDRQKPAQKPVKTLMRLAQERVRSRLAETEIWPRLEEALTAASRPHEAAVFTGLMQDYKALKTALRQGDLVTVERLLTADMPLPEEITLGDALNAHPHLGTVVAYALLEEGRAEDLASIFGRGHVDVRTAILEMAAFRDTELCLSLYREAVCQPSAEALAHLMARCSPEQVMHILTQDAEPGETVAMACMMKVAQGRSMPGEADMVALMLPMWIEAGGDPVEIMLRRPLKGPVIDVLARNGACPTDALVRLTRRRQISTGSCYLRLKMLLDHGARLTHEQFAAYVERHRDEADYFEDLNAPRFGRTLALFKSRGAIPYADGSLGDQFSVQAWREQSLRMQQPPSR